MKILKGFVLIFLLCCCTVLRAQTVEYNKEFAMQYASAAQYAGSYKDTQYVIISGMEKYQPVQYLYKFDRSFNFLKKIKLQYDGMEHFHLSTAQTYINDSGNVNIIFNEEHLFIMRVSFNENGKATFYQISNDFTPRIKEPNRKDYRCVSAISDNNKLILLSVAGIVNLYDDNTHMIWSKDIDEEMQDAQLLNDGTIIAKIKKDYKTRLCVIKRSGEVLRSDEVYYNAEFYADTVNNRIMVMSLMSGDDDTYNGKSSEPITSMDYWEFNLSDLKQVKKQELTFNDDMQMMTKGTKKPKGMALLKLARIIYTPDQEPVFIFQAYKEKGDGIDVVGLYLVKIKSSGGNIQQFYPGQTEKGSGDYLTAAKLITYLQDDKLYVVAPGVKEGHSTINVNRFTKGLKLIDKKEFPYTANAKCRMDIAGYGKLADDTCVFFGIDPTGDKQVSAIFRK